MIPAVPLSFLPVWLGLVLIMGWIGWRTRNDGWYAAAFAWLVFIGPVCWLMLGAAVS